MAKVAYSKLGLKRDDSVETFEWNGQTIEVKQHLPIEDKLNLVTLIINESLDENGFYNPARIFVYLVVETVLAYTNITVTEKQKEDIPKLFDCLSTSGFSGKVIGEAMNPVEYKEIGSWVHETIKSIYEYRNSVYGILDSVKADYDNMNLDANNIYEKLKDPDNLTLLKDVMEKLG